MPCFAALLARSLVRTASAAALASAEYCLMSRSSSASASPSAMLLEAAIPPELGRLLGGLAVCRHYNSCTLLIVTKRIRNIDVWNNLLFVRQLVTRVFIAS